MHASKHLLLTIYFAIFTLHTFFLHTIQGIGIKKMRKWFSVLFLVLSTVKLGDKELFGHPKIVP